MTAKETTTATETATLTKYRFVLDSDNRGHMELGDDTDFYMFDNPANTENEIRCIKNNMAALAEMSPIDRVLFVIKNRK